MKELTDSDIMPYGVHKGKQLADIPDDYFLWAYNEKKASPSVRAYIIKNLDAIKANADRKRGIIR